MTDLQPDVPDVLQEEADPGAITVPVCVVEQRAPLRTQALPRKAGATLTRTLTTDPLRILRADHRRASAVLVTTEAEDAFRYALNAASAQDPSSMAVWPGAVPLVLDATTDIYVCAATGTVDLGVATSLWAEGEGGA